MKTNPITLARLSGRYARYGRSLPGLSLALGGVVMLLFFLIWPFLINHLSAHPENGWSLAALITALLLAGWILAKEWLRQRIYLSIGLAEAPGSTAEIRLNRALAAMVALLALAFPISALVAPGLAYHAPSQVQTSLGLAACFALPWCTLRFIRGVLEGLLWIALCYWALSFIWAYPLGMTGGGPKLGALGWILILTLPLAYFGGLIVGLVQHFNFMRLAREIRSRETPDE